MTSLVVLDSGPLGLILHPHQSPEHRACLRWMQELLEDGSRVVLPEIVDYETRRALIRLRSARSLEALDGLAQALHYEPLTTVVMRLAAQYWADARASGLPTAPDNRLDVDAILAAQAAALRTGDSRVVIATTNIRHLSRFPGAHAELWRLVRP